MSKLDWVSQHHKRPFLLFMLNAFPSGMTSAPELPGWQSLRADSLKHAEQIISKEDIRVAIVPVSNYQPELFKAIERLNRINGRIQWIAILPQTLLSDSKVMASGHFTSLFTNYFTDYHHLPIECDRLGHTLGHAYGIAMLQRRADNSFPSRKEFLQLIGSSDLIIELEKSIDKIAATDGAVLISGETGTGKGLCAKLIHSLSPRREGPMITINCAALPASLIHSELFGHEKGAFTGAQSRYIGHIERANHGTLFLDEIGDLSLDLQVNLLQFLEDHCIERLGGHQQLEIDCRILFASHIDLENAIDEGRFREDLYHRLNILRLHVPSLRDRKQDMPSLTEVFLGHYAPEGKHFLLSDEAQTMVQAYDWPGNVRELKNRLQRAIVMADSPIIAPEDLGIVQAIARQNMVGNEAELAGKRTETDTELLLAAIERNNHNISAAARELNISRTTFYRLVKKCQIKL
jgi:DNA-binding NtrC family response regulator